MHIIHGQVHSLISLKKSWIEAAKPIENIENVDLKAGEFKYIKSMKKLIAASNDGFFELMSLKPAGKKAQDGAAFWNGSKLKDKELFENDYKEAIAASGSGRSLENLIKVSEELKF